jgi:D-alanyl-D-alanine carboxypeptidase
MTPTLRPAAALFLTFLAAPLAAPAPTETPLPRAPDCSAPDSAGAGPRFDCRTLATIDAVAAQMVTSGHTPGLEVAIMRRGQMLFNNGYGKANLETDSPFTPATVFPIYSISKTFTAAAILQLRDAGRLSLDDKLSRYLPDFPRGEEVTLRHLLSHTSGIHDHAGMGGPPSTLRRTSSQLIDYIRAQTPLYDSDPGTKYAYSNSNFALLAKIVEQVSGRSYREYVTDSVVGRVPFLKTTPDQSFDVVPGRASGYLRTNYPGRFANAPSMDKSFSFGSGNIRSTAADLALWFTALFDGRIVSAASLEEMTTTSRLRDGRPTGGSWGSYGLGMEIQTVEGHRVLGHSGATQSFNAVANYYPDDGFMLVIFSNSSRDAMDLEERIGRILFPPKGH